MKNMDKKTLITLGVAIVGAILALIGVFTPFVTGVMKNGGMSASVNAKLNELGGLKMEGLLRIVAYVTMLASVASCVLYVVNCFKPGEKLAKVAKIVSLVAVILVAAVVVIGLIFCISNKTETMGTTMEFWFAIGAWLLIIGGVLAAGAPFLAYKKEA